MVDANTLQDVRRFHDNDLFTVAGLFARADIVRWNRHIGNEGQAAYQP